MMEMAVASFAALLIAAGFACVGDLLLRRRSRSIFSINESFLVGAAVLASILFPISLVAGAWSVDFVAVILTLSAAFWLARHKNTLRMGVRRSAAVAIGKLSRLRTRSLDRSLITFLLRVILLAYVLVFCAISLKHAIVSDGLHIWASKGVVLYYKGLTRELWSEGGYDSRVTGYPHLIPLYEALIGKVIGRFSFFHLSPMFALFEISLRLSMYRASRAATGRTIALLATLCLALAAPFLDDTSLGGFADVPLAAFAAANMAVWLTRDPHEPTLRSPIPWLMAGLLTVKTEGIILFGASIIVALGAWIISRKRGSITALNSSWAAVLLGALVLRLGYLSSLTAVDATYGPVNGIYLRRALAFLPQILRLCWDEASNTSNWGWLWIGFPGAVAAVAIAGRARERAIAAAAVLTLACYTVAFGFSKWPLLEHVHSAYPRLLMQLTPAALLIVACTYRIGVEGFLRFERGKMMTSTTTMKFSSGAVAFVCLVGIVMGWFARGFIAPPLSAEAQQELTQNIPIPESVSPVQGSGPRQTFTVTVSAPRGYTTIRSVGLLINSAVMASRSCYPKYDVSTGNAGLIDDAGVSLLAPAQSGAKLENSQCVIDTDAITAHREGKKVTISIPITFKPGFVGSKSIFVIATNATGKASELEMQGSWTVSGF